MVEIFLKQAPEAIQKIETALSTSNWKEVHAGQGHSIGIKEDSTLWAWGFNTYGQLGIGNTTNQSSPVQIGNLHDWLTASCGGVHTLVLKADSTLWAFGYNFTGELGDSTTIQSNVPIQIGQNHEWTSVSAGFQFSLATVTIDPTKKM